jgi:hypothetical protein
MLIDELLIYLFDGKPHLLAAQMETWLASSRRFTAFVNAFHNKIRKKLRATQEMESLLDLHLELETAYLLLQERSLSLVYEPQLGGKSRGPDFAVSFTTSLLFMVEVTRLRLGQDDTRDPTQALAADEAPKRSPFEERLTDMVCSKLGQLMPQRTNILLAGVEAPGLTQDFLRAAMLQLQQRAERNDPAVLHGHGFRDRADFFRHYGRLSELLVRGPNLQEGGPMIGWVNPQGKYPLPSKVRTVLYRSHNAAVG